MDLVRMSRLWGFILVLACGLVFAATGAGGRLDLKLLDSQFRWLRAAWPKAVSRDVAVVGIDEETVARFPEPLALWHAHLRRFLDAMAAAGPAVVGLDLVLPDRSYDEVLPGSDRLLLEGLLEARRAFPLVLALTVDPSGRPRPIHRPFATLAGEGGVGYALFPLDGDGSVRRFDERFPGAAAPLPTLAGQMARHLGVEPRAGFIDYWRGERFEHVPLHRVLQWHAAGDRASLERAFRGRPVLLGTVFAFEDRLVTPVSLSAPAPDARDTPGVFVHAQTLRNMLNGGFVAPVPAAAVAAVCAALAGLWFFSSGTVAMALLLAGIVSLLAAASTLLLAQGWFFPAVAPAATAALALGGRSGWETLLKLRERRRLRASFSGYVSPAVLEEILAGRIRPELGGETRFVCVLFSDIRGYTGRSERMAASEVVRFLNRYFEEVVTLIHGRGGTVTSFMGDGIMAVFGAPKPLANPCREAFEAARAMLRHVRHLNERLCAEGEAPMEIGIGLHAGEAVIGHVGSSRRHDYTAIGDVTNVASRLETLTKETGYRILVSRAVAERLGPEPGLAPLGPLAVKGHSPVEAYGFDGA